MCATELIRGSAVHKKLLGVKNFWDDKYYVSGPNRNNSTLVLPKPADFAREMSPMPGTSKE